MSKDLEVLRMRLKSGEYDGVHIMKAWIAIEELCGFCQCELEPEEVGTCNYCENYYLNLEDIEDNDGY